jgi:AraC-like DNA-binding protein
MSVYRHCPVFPLSRYVDFFWYYVDFNPDHTREHVLPDGTFELIINLQETPRKLFSRSDPGRYTSFRRGWISGAHSKFLVIDALQGSSMIGIHFKPGGAVAFLGMPANEFKDQVVELDSFWGESIWDWRERMLAAKGPQKKFRVLETFLMDRLQHCRLKRNNAVGWALERYLAEPHIHSITSVSSQLGFSHKHFIELVRRETGLTPKLFCRIRRFQRVLLEVHSRGWVDWGDVAYSCGYFDQSHFVHDFFNFSGLNPSAYLDRRLDGELNFVRAG